MNSLVKTKENPALKKIRRHSFTNDAVGRLRNLGTLLKWHFRRVNYRGNGEKKATEVPSRTRSALW